MNINLHICFQLVTYTRNTKEIHKRIKGKYILCIQFYYKLVGQMIDEHKIFQNDHLAEQFIELTQMQFVLKEDFGRKVLICYLSSHVRFFNAVLYFILCILAEFIVFCVSFCQKVWSLNSPECISKIKLIQIQSLKSTSDFWQKLSLSLLGFFLLSRMPIETAQPQIPPVRHLIKRGFKLVF